MKNKQVIQLTKTYRHLKHRYLTMNNVVIGIAIVIGASWAWGSIGMMQRNYSLQKEIDAKVRQEKIAKLTTENLAYQQRYFQSSEYREVSARRYLGLADPGEKVLILPANSQSVKEAGKTPATKASIQKSVPPSNFEQWLSFLFGGSRRDLHS